MTDVSTKGLIFPFKTNNFIIYFIKCEQCWHIVCKYWGLIYIKKCQNSYFLDPVLAVIKLNTEVEVHWTLLHTTPSNLSHKKEEERKNSRYIWPFSFFKTNMSQKNGTKF